MVREVGVPSPEKRWQTFGKRHREIQYRIGQLQSVPCNLTNSEETMSTPKYDRTLTVRAAANYLGLSASTLNKLRCTGAGPVYFKLGRAVRYDPQDLDDWLTARRVSSTSRTV